MPIPSSPIVSNPIHTKRRGSSYDYQRFEVLQHQSTDSFRPKTGSSRLTSSHRASQSYDNIRMGVLPSPSTANFDIRAHPMSLQRQSILHPPSPPPQPPIARVRRSTSPAIKPINSSHPWVTSTYLGQKRENPNISSSGTATPDVELEAFRTRDVRSGVQASYSQDQGRRVSLESSLRAENGSGRSMALAMHRQRLQLSQGYPEEDSSDDDFMLPLQKPSPRNSAAAWDLVRPRCSRAYSSPALQAWPHG